MQHCVASTRYAELTRFPRLTIGDHATAPVLYQEGKRPNTHGKDRHQGYVRLSHGNTAAHYAKMPLTSKPTHKVQSIWRIRSNTTGA